MKNITISIDDEVYRAANEEAARRRKSLGELVQEFLARLRTEQGLNGREAQTEPESPAATDAAEDEALREQRESLAQFFDELNARPLKEGPSVGPLNREELYQRGTQTEAESAADEAKRAEFLMQLQQLFDQADERDRLKEGRLVPLTREEIYAERLDRFR